MIRIVSKKHRLTVAIWRCRIIDERVFLPLYSLSTNKFLIRLKNYPIQFKLLTLKTAICTQYECYWMKAFYIENAVVCSLSVIS